MKHLKRNKHFLAADGHSQRLAVFDAYEGGKERVESSQVVLLEEGERKAGEEREEGRARTGWHGDDDAAPLDGLADALAVDARVAVERAGAVAVATRGAHHEQARRAHRLLESCDAHAPE